MYILGISALYHDSAAALVKDGEIIAAAQEERFTRKKHDPDFPLNAINYCLHQAKIDIKQVNYIGFYDKPIIKFERILETYLTTAPRGLKSFLQALPLWLKDKLWMKDYIRKQLKYKGPILFGDHHESHAASAFYPSPFSRAAILTVDGVGEWTSTSYGYGENKELHLLRQISFPSSLGLLYSAFTYFTGFKVNFGEYKLMGLAPYGEPKYVDQIRSELIDIRDDGSFRLNQKYFDYLGGLKMTNKRFANLFNGPPRKPESPLTTREMDLASSVQVVTEEVMLKLAKQVKKETGEKNLCLAGGVALNCVANGKILKAGIFDDIWIQPAAGDAGGALGIALRIWHKLLNNDKPEITSKDWMYNAYLGPEFSDEEIVKILDENQAVYHQHSYAEVSQIAAQLLAEEKVIGWFQGRMEFGPRALGSRSIIGDPRSEKMQSWMNLKIKFRESFRPFAPTILEEDVSEYFDLDRPSPYMLLVAPVAKKHLKQLSEEEAKLQGLERLKISRSEVPAITHVDNSARIQTINRNDNPMYYDLIKEFKKLTGCPLIINTSFNIRGEPIVCTPADGFRCFVNTGMDVLVIGSYILYKKEQKEEYQLASLQQEKEMKESARLGLLD